LFGNWIIIDGPNRNMVAPAKNRENENRNFLGIFENSF
jgi:hypothetical protein